jgi:hypothetical protein
MSSDSIIKPTVGRVVWYLPHSSSSDTGFAVHPGEAQGRPYAAIIAHVWHDGMVNLSVFDAHGVPHSRTSVTLIQDSANGAGPQFAQFCTWMPFQRGQAKAQDAAAATLPVSATLQHIEATEPVPYVFLVSFGDALQALKQGARVARMGWNGKGMWLALSCDGTREVPATSLWAPANRAYAEQQPNGTAMVQPCITMKTSSGEIQMGWAATQSDMLAEDWWVLPD